MKRKTCLVTRAQALQKHAAQQLDAHELHKPLSETILAKQLVQLPSWSQMMRGVPNGVLRSALFGAIKKGARRYMQGELIASIDGVEIRYTGQRLDQGDLDVWENVLHALRIQAMGTQYRVTAYALLKLMGKSDSGKNRATLQTRIERLRANAINIKQGRYSYIGGLVDEAFKDEDTQEWVLGLNPKLCALFATDQFTQIEWTVRRMLDGKPLAQWLHGYYASHAKPYPVRMETLLKLSGSDNANPRSALQKLRKALDAVIDANKSNGQLFSYKILGELVHVEKKPSVTQQRHLAKKEEQQRKR